ncbi:LOW QUALITY PROTEIN: hypothetical protein U9M48_020237 [Paspalum notatum var. saurae]|uniref:Uncharacterized protein n=1 Tax=Paspalum notatum var. saurae TaxID=547442 RepID=A0AAQ3WRT7_PASNO
MEGNAAQWFQVYKARQGIGTWAKFVEVVHAKFGVYDYQNAVTEFLDLKQTGTVEEYVAAFEELQFQVAAHNMGMDEVYFVSQFMRGLKPELRYGVHSQMPETVEKAIMLAKIQQKLLEEPKAKMARGAITLKSNNFPLKQEQKSQFNPALTKERQLRDFRRANGLCYYCGDKFDSTHLEKCPKRQKLQANALVINELDVPQLDVPLTDEVLNQLAIEDSLAEEFCTLSLNALSGTDTGPCMKLKSFGNKVMLLLVDSGSSHSFVNGAFLNQVSCQMQKVSPSKVKLANGDEIVTNQAVTGLEWWCQGHTFTTPMKVLPLGSYDAILGYDWLEMHSPMQFTLKGVPPVPLQLTEMYAEQLVKWSKGNDIWACALVAPISSEQSPSSFPEITTILKEYSEVFTIPTALPPHRHYDHTIPILPGATPVNSRPYRYSHLHKDEIERQIKKKDGSWHMCVDYRRLNAITVKNRFPIPLVEEILDELSGSKYFTKLDLTSRYYQVRMAPQDEYKTAFKTHHGHYHFKVMPFGLTNAPATFQCIMNDILSPFLRKFVMVFMDDILVYSPTLSQHVEHLTSVLKQLRQHKFYLKLVKCSFAQHKLEYLGHIISGDGVATDPSKTAAMQAWPTPTSVTELRGFLGLTGYYRRFIKGYGILARLLTILLKKDAFQWTDTFQWTDSAEQSFLALKQAMQNTPVLALPNFQLPFIVETDACALGIGTVLMQQERPIAYLSKALGEKQKQLSIYEKEFLALIMAVEKWRQYLQRTEFIIRTDHSSLAYLSEQNLHSELQRKAMARTMGLQLKVKGKYSCGCFVSCGSPNGYSISFSGTTSQEVLNSYTTDPVAQKLLAQLAIHSPDSEGYELVDGLIKHKVIAAMHSSPIGGHSGAKATYYRVKRLFGWKGLRSDVDDFVKQCHICQQSKHELIHTHPGSCSLCQYLQVLGLILLWILLKGFQLFFQYHPGGGGSAYKNRDRIFLSTFWKELFQLLGTKLASSTAYHPQMDGQTERVNQCLEMYLRCSISASPRDWKAWLPLAELWYNSAHHASLGCSPFKALYGYEPNTVLAKVGDAAYKIQLPSGTLIHPVFHVSQLKPFTPNYSPVYSDTAEFAELDKTDVLPEAILDRRPVKKGNQAITQVLIKWTNLPATLATWKDYNVVTARFPSAVAWGQATSQGGGDVSTMT